MSEVVLPGDSIAPSRGPWRRAIARRGPGRLVVTAAALLLTACGPNAAGGPTGSTGPAPTASAGQSANASTATASAPVMPAGPSPEIDDPGGDPSDLPRMPGATLIGYGTHREDGLVVAIHEYRIAADLEAVRRHYRAALREHGWRVGEVESEPDGWEIDASRGSREVELEIERDGDHTVVEVTISEPAPGAP